MTTHIVRTDLGARAYDIVIGPEVIARAGEYLLPLMKRPRSFIVTDENVATHHLEPLKESLRAHGIESDQLILPAGEQTKSFTNLEGVTSAMLDAGIERNDIIIALGGGVIGDLTGFAASILRRGCLFAQIPTTLLAQVDSSVGGKTAINVAQGKNLIGAFYQPAIVLSDVGALSTLDDRQLRAGYAEVLKYAAINDPTFFEWLEENLDAILRDRRGDTLTFAIKKSCEAKAAIVAEDETERGARALLNLGHTFGHAFEGAYGYSEKLLHGEAVALGMALAFEYSTQTENCPADDAEKIKAHLDRAGLPSAIDQLPDWQTLKVENLMALMAQDKKVEQGDITLILADGIGKSKIVKNASYDHLASFLSVKTSTHND